MKFNVNSPESKGFLIAPMVDILLVLLGFFMLTWSMSLQEKELNIQLPTTHSRANTVESEKLIVNVYSDGHLVINHQTVSASDLLIKLKQLLELDSNQAVIIRGDNHLEYGKMVNLLDICSQANITNISLATLPVL